MVFVARIGHSIHLKDRNRMNETQGSHTGEGKGMGKDEKDAEGRLAFPLTVHDCKL